MRIGSAGTPPPPPASQRGLGPGLLLGALVWCLCGRPAHALVPGARTLGLRVGRVSCAAGPPHRTCALRSTAPGAGSDSSLLDVHVVLPCLNEERILPATLERLCGFLERQDWQWRVTVVDNGSTDGTSNTTLAFARSGAPGTAPRSRNVALMRLEDRGRGLALRNAWLNDSAAIQSYMDVDLSTDLDAFSALVHTVHNGSADVAVASRHAAGAQVVGRSRLRGLTSKGLSLLIRCFFWRFRVKDTQCGCKVMTRQAAADLLPAVRNQHWFFDTELLLRARAARMRLHERGVLWTDDRDSRVEVAGTIFEMLAGLLRMRLTLWAQRVVGALQSLRSRVVPAARHVAWRLEGEGRVLVLRAYTLCLKTMLAAYGLVRGIVLAAVIQPLNAIIVAVASCVPDELSPNADIRVPDDAGKIDASAIMRTGVLQSLGVKQFTARYMSGLELLTKKLARAFLSRFDEGQLMGMISMAGTELVAREVSRQIAPLPPDVQDKAVRLSERAIAQLEAKLVEFGQDDWLMDVFLSSELQRLPDTLTTILRDPWNSIPLLQEPAARDDLALILQAIAKAEVEATRVLKAIGLSDQQSSLFLELNRTTTTLQRSPAAAAPRTLAPPAGRGLGAPDRAPTLQGDRLEAVGGGGRLGSRGDLTSVYASIVEGSGGQSLAATVRLLSDWEASLAAGNFSYLASVASYLRDWEAAVYRRYKALSSTSDGTVSWKEVWESLYGEGVMELAGQNQTSVVDPGRNASNASEPLVAVLPTVPSASLQFLESVQSQVAISPDIFGLLRDAAELTLLNNSVQLRQSESPSTERAESVLDNVVASLTQTLGGAFSASAGVMGPVSRVDLDGAVNVIQRPMAFVKDVGKDVVGVVPFIKSSLEDYIQSNLSNSSKASLEVINTSAVAASVELEATLRSLVTQLEDELAKSVRILSADPKSAANVSVADTSLADTSVTIRSARDFLPAQGPPRRSWSGPASAAGSSSSRAPDLPDSNPRPPDKLPDAGNSSL